MSRSGRESLRRQQAAQAKAKRLNRIVGVSAGILGLVLVAVFALIIVQTWGQAGPGIAGAPPNATSSGNGIVVNPGKAAANAPTVELFVDYQCPACKDFETRNGALVKELADSGRISLIYRTRTFLDGNLRNDASLRSAQAAACADRVGVYSAYHDAVFARQPAVEGAGYTDDVLRVEIPLAIGLTGEPLTRFVQCVGAQTTRSFVQAVDEAAARDGVNRTPSLWVNGKAIDNTRFMRATSEELTTILLGG